MKLKLAINLFPPGNRMKIGGGANPPISRNTIEIEMNPNFLFGILNGKFTYVLKGAVLGVFSMTAYDRDANTMQISAELLASEDPDQDILKLEAFGWTFDKDACTRYELKCK